MAKKKTDKKPTKGLVISENDMTSLVCALDRVTDFIYSKKEILISKEIIEDDEVDGDIPKELLGYKVQLTDVQGDHRNDGQMVDYTFTFTNPKGKETDVSTEMCLMVGWNFGTWEGKGYEIK
jgi:hypothetical protein